MDPFQRNRFISFLNPEQFTDNISLNINRAQIVAGSGGANGKGLFSPDLLTGQSGYLPEQHTDFIFAANTEAVGFWGGVILLLLYLGLIVRLLVLSMRAKDKFGSYIIIGVA